MTCGRQFADHVPNECPSLPHEGRPGFYYRFVSDPAHPTPEDFQSQEELGMHRPRSVDICDWCAISLWGSIERAKNALLQYPKIARRHIVEIELKGEHGVVHKTAGDPAGHYGWWPIKGIDLRGFCRRGIQ